MKWNKNFTNYIKFLHEKLQFNDKNLDKVYAIYRCFDVIFDLHDNPNSSTAEISKRLGVQTFAIRNKLRDLGKYNLIKHYYDKRSPKYFNTLLRSQIEFLKIFCICGYCKELLKTKNIFMFVNKSYGLIKVFCSNECKRGWCNDPNRKV